MDFSQMFISFCFPYIFRQTRRSRSRSRCSTSKSKHSTDKYHWYRPKSPSPHCSRDIKQSGSGTSSQDIKPVRASTPKREAVPLLPDVESPLISQLSEPDFPELFGTQ